MDTGTKIFLSGIIVYWFICFVYMLRWHVEQGNLSVGTVFLEIIISPVIALIIKSDNSWREGEAPSYNGERITEDESYTEYLRDYRARYENVPVINNTKKPKKLDNFKFFQK